MEQELEVSIPSYVCEYTNGKQTVFYNIECKMGGSKWKIKKRYNDFNVLMIELKNHHGNLPSLPGKTLFSLKKPDQLEKRKQKLASLLKSIANRPDLYSNPEFIRFFALNERKPGVRVNRLEQIGKVTHAFLGYRDFILLPSKKIFFSLVSDMSAISR